VDEPVARMLRADVASAALGIEVLASADGGADAGADADAAATGGAAGGTAGTARARMTVRPDMVNGHGIAHGAFVFAVADTAFAAACNSHGPVTVAAAADITFVAPAHVGDVLEAIAVERIRFGRSGIYDVTVRRGDAVVAEFRGTSRALRATAP
jgi:acyl-CoA thioesterase